MKYYVGIDLGGTNIVAGVVNEEYEIVAKVSAKTHKERGAEEIIATMAEVAREAVVKAGITMEQVESVGVGSPGIANRDTGYLEIANNLKFKDLPMVEMLETLLGTKVFIDNDANAAAYGEFMAGAAKGTKHAIAVTLGTGVGGGIIVDGKCFAGFNFAGAELGHTVIEANGRQCNCGRQGCWEAYSSATALIISTKEAMGKTKDTIMWEMCDNDINKVSGRTAFDAMKKGDKLAKEVVDEYIHYFSVGITNIVNTFSPEVICVGGGISKEGDVLLEPVREFVGKQAYGRFAKKQTRIVTATLGNDAGVMGAALLGFGK